MKIAKLLLSIGSLCVGLTGLAGEARADFTVVIDCYGNNGQPTWANTSNKITVKALINGEYLTVGSQSSIACTYEDSIRLYSPAFEASDVTRVRISTNGSDAFWMDEVMLYNHDKASVNAQWGGDNNVGYCLSEDSSDGDNAYCWNAKAYGAINFNK